MSKPQPRNFICKPSAPCFHPFPQALRARYARALHHQSGAAAAMAAEHAATARAELAAAAGGGARRAVGGPVPQMMPSGMPRGDGRWASMMTREEMLGRGRMPPYGAPPGWAPGRVAGGRGGRPGASAHGLDGVGTEEVGLSGWMVSKDVTFHHTCRCCTDRTLSLLSYVFSWLHVCFRMYSVILLDCRSNSNAQEESRSAVMNDCISICDCWRAAIVNCAMLCTTRLTREWLTDLLPTCSNLQGASRQVPFLRKVGLHNLPPSFHLPISLSEPDFIYFLQSSTRAKLTTKKQYLLSMPSTAFNLIQSLVCSPICLTCTPAVGQQHGLSPAALLQRPVSNSAPASSAAAGGQAPPSARDAQPVRSCQLT